MSSLAAGTDPLELALSLSAALRKLPPISPLVPKLMRLKANDEVDLTALQKIIESDPGLSARLIGLANSVYYSRGGRSAYNVYEALMRLGYQQAWQISLSFVLGSAVTIDPVLRGAKQTLWAHSYAVGICSREVASASDVPNCDPDLAFLGGFLHDIGYIAILALEPRKAHDMLGMMQNPEQGYARGMEAKFGLANHDLIGGELAKLWGLPEDVAQIVALHNQSVLDIDTPVQSVIGAVQLGHAITLDIFPPQGINLQQESADLPDLLANLGISNKTYVAMHEWLAEKVEGIQFMASSA
ncbi:HDOD domain-containing protein [Parvibium lacunae]|uniref:HDOD domain-containing protein n=1 Tax=Parvibium lacunae TaxID=1888893 RepID=A0A368L4N4_9BURK|nr:HDOD domain-containing protein [Parvibium lacunae]RCS58546.1 HDOD domain-containing protein [Parvibium lacunae]